MKAKHEFDMVHGAQEVFRLFLEALANPGRILSLGQCAARFRENGLWLAPALTLLDNETGFYWRGPDETGEEIRFLTGAVPASPEKADFLFLSAPASGLEAADILSRAKAGSPENPHDSALILAAVPGEGSRSLPSGAFPRKETLGALLRGPGVPPEGRRIDLCPAEAAWLRAREAQGFEYPCGVELVFIREDLSFMAITRKAEVTWPTQR
ncbi:MAG: phosphonate C-P lyase system protein PhnH [Treponema sp.]|jgi:phosphonate C-P lyase system protein PhnH|nr:phosphonate C-P lyase system protein PhnH [Treponema sp.]